VMRFCSLGSGSKGNATLVAVGDTLVMVDCGFSVRETTRRLALLNLTPDAIDAILVTHEHSDHCAGVAKLSRRYDIPVYLSHGTHNSGRCDGSAQLHCFNSDHSFGIGELLVTSVAVPHDAREPCQFRFEAQGSSLGVLTDLGSITPHVVSSYRGCDALLLEFNHDVALLMNGSYPPQLKRRVAGDWGHLNNEQAVALLDELGEDGPRCLVVAHISEKNNCRDRARNALERALHQPSTVVWAEQGQGFDWLDIA
jgi:phosphoribosyl 1,2-cyclic phosphodiesterase